MQSNATLTTCASRDSDRAALIRRWLVKFGAVYGREITPLLVASWEEALSHISEVALLDRAFLGAERTCRQFFPTPADVLAQIADANTKGFQLQAEAAWEWALDVARRFYFPDLGLRGAPEIPPATEFAVQACGGWRRLHLCSEDDLVWCRKTFLERYTTLHETRAVEHLLGSGEARQILQRLAAGPEPKQLPARDFAKPATKPTREPTDQDIRTGFATLRERLGVRPAAVRAKSPEELQAEADRQRRALAEYLAKQSREVVAR